MPGKMRKPTGATRPPSLRGAIIIDETRGAPRVRAWPRPRGSDRHPTNVFWTNWLRWATYLYRYYPAQLKADLEQQTAGTPWMPRDVAISAMRARAWNFTGPDGRTYYPMAARDDISNSLDIIAQLPGQMLFRSSGLWVPIPGGNPGQQLTYVSEDDPPAWESSTVQQLVALPILSGDTSAPNWPVNSTTYVIANNRIVPIDLADFTFDEYRILLWAASSQAGQTIAAILAEKSAPTTSLSGNAIDVTITNTAGLFDSGWQPNASGLTGLQSLGISLKGSNATVDLNVNYLTLYLRR